MNKTLGSFTILLGLLCGPIIGPPGAQETGFGQPLLITSAGQSAEVQLASVLAKRAGLAFTLAKSAGPEDLEQAATLALSLGASLKGLGAAGLDVQQEKERVSALVVAAASQNIPVICLHLGGEARRGQLSDDFISTFLPYARLALVVKSGNQDGLFSRLCQEHDIQLIEVERVADALEPLKGAFH
jgi:hypothetical protein